MTPCVALLLRSPRCSPAAAAASSERDEARCSSSSTRRSRARRTSAGRSRTARGSPRREVNAAAIRVGGTHVLPDGRARWTTASPPPARSRTSAGRSPTARSRSSTRARASTRPGASPTRARRADRHRLRRAASLVDAETRPNVFRIAPTDHGIAFRLAEYLIPKGLKIALLHDDSDYGDRRRDGAEAAFSRNRSPSRSTRHVPAGRARPRAAGRSARAARTRRRCSSGAGRRRSPRRSPPRARPGWDVPVYTPPTGADPFVRQQLADHPAWVDGLTFAGGPPDGRGRRRRRSTTFAAALRGAYGVDRVGVQDERRAPRSSSRRRRRCTPTTS